MLEINSSLTANEEGTLETTAGDSISLNITIEAPAGFRSVSASASLNNQPADLPFPSQLDANSDEVNVDEDSINVEVVLNFDIEASFEGDLVLTFIALDDIDQSTTATITIRVNAAPEGVVSFTNIVLGGQRSTQAASLNAINGSTLGIETAIDNSELVDIVYFWSEENGNSLASPDSRTLQAAFPEVEELLIKNATRLQRTVVTQEAFNGIATAEQLRSIASSLQFQSDNREVGDLAVGDVISFLFDFNIADDDFGLIKIEEINDTDGSGTITISLLIPASIAE